MGRFGGAFAFFFILFAFYILAPYLIGCYKCHELSYYCGPEIVHACSPLPWIFTAMIFILLLLGRWKYLSLALVIIGVVLGISQLLFVIPNKLFFIIIVPTYFMVGIGLSSIPIILFIARGAYRLGSYIIKRGARGVTWAPATTTRTSSTPLKAQARGSSVLAPPPRPAPAPQAVLKWVGEASALNNIIVLRHSPPSTISSTNVSIVIEHVGRAFKLIVEDVEYPVESLNETNLLEALKKCSNMKSASPRYDVYYDLVLWRNAFEDVRQKLSSMGRIELSGIKTVIKRRVLRPTFLKRVATHQFVKYMFPSRIPKKLYILDYGRAFDSAVKALARTQSLERAKMKFLMEFMRGKIAKQYIERGALSLEEVGANAFRGLEIFERTEFYTRYRKSYLIPKPRIILIDDAYAVFAQPDFKSTDNTAIIDVKVFDPNKASKEEREKVELEMRVFQLAYPGAKAILLGFPYGEEYEAPKSLELPPLQPSEALQLLEMLKKFCADKGSYQAIDLPKYETICYTINPDGYEFEVYEFEAK